MSAVREGAEEARKLLGFSVDTVATGTGHKSVNTTIPTPFVKPPTDWPTVLSDFGRRLPVLVDNLRLMGEYRDPAVSRSVIERAEILDLVESANAILDLDQRLTELYEACLVIAVQKISKDPPGSRCDGQTNGLQEVSIPLLSLYHSGLTCSV